MEKDLRYGQSLNLLHVRAFNSHVRGEQSSQLNGIVFSSNRKFDIPEDFVDFFLNIRLHKNTYYIDFSNINSWCITKEVCEAIPTQITTLEVSLELEEGSFGIPPGLKYASNISTLFINYPLYISQLEDFDLILNDLHNLTENLPHLKQVYFKTDVSNPFNMEISEHEISYTRQKILKTLLSTNVEECRFYIGSVNDKLVSKYKQPVAFNKLYSFFEFFTQKNKIPLEILAIILLYADTMLKPKTIKELLEQMAKKYWFAQHYPCETGRLLKEYSLFNQNLKTWIQDNRHKNPEVQHEYDKRFGLVSLANTSV